MNQDVRLLENAPMVSIIGTKNTECCVTKIGMRVDKGY